MGLEVRRLEPGQLQQLFRFRHAVFVGELGALVSREEIERGYMTDPLDEVGWNYGAFLDGALIGSLRVVDLGRVPDPGPLVEKYRLGPAIERFGIESLCHVGRLALAPEVRSGNVLAALIVRAYAEALERRLHVAVSDCSPYLLPLYETLGYRAFGAPFNDRVYGLKLPILLLIRDLAHIRALRSPFAAAAERVEPDDGAARWFRETYPTHASDPGQVASARVLDVAAAFLGREHLHSHSLLLDLEPGEVQSLLAQAVTVRAQPGDFLIRRGLKEANLYFLLGGVIKVLDDSGREVLLLGKGDFVGEMALLTNATRSADVLACEPTECILINARTLERLFDANPRLYAKLMRNIARSLVVRLQAAVPREST
jgi:hypothetical protein